MKKVIIIFQALFILSFLFSQNSPDTLWTKTFGGTLDDRAYSVQQTTDGGYIFAGMTISYGFGVGDFWLLKTDENGNEQWNRTYGGTNWDEAYSVIQTIDGGYIMVGESYSYGAGGTDWYIIKTDENGNEEWSQTFGGAEDDRALSIQQTNDEGYILAGHTESFGAGSLDVWLIKMDGNGNLIWDNTFGDNGWDDAFSVKQTSDNGFIIAGQTSTNYVDIWLVKTDENGNEEWNTTFGGNQWDSARSVLQTSDNGYAIIGQTASYGAGIFDIWLIKTDVNGNEEWNQTYGYSDVDSGSSFVQTSDNGFIIAGSTKSFGSGDYDGWIIKTDGNGNEEWSQTYGGIDLDRFSSIHKANENDFIVAGYTRSYGVGGLDMWLLKFNSNTSIDDNLIYINQNFVLNNFPNPFNPKTTISFSIQNNSKIELSIFNIKGQKVKSLISDQLPAGEHSVVWDGRDSNGKRVGSGIYFYKLNVNGKTEAVKKCLLLK